MPRAGPFQGQTPPPFMLAIPRAGSTCFFILPANAVRDRSDLELVVCHLQVPRCKHLCEERRVQGSFL